MNNDKCLVSDLAKSSGVNISQCYQCGKCTAGCAMAYEMDFPPSYMIRLLQTNKEENYRKVLSSHTIWMCVNCENCIARCPKEVNIPKLMDYLREESHKANSVNHKDKPVVAFHQAFLDCVQRTGRLYEIGLIADFKLRTLRLAQDLKVAPVMFAKGKLNLLPEIIKNPKRMERIFSKTIDNTNKKHS